MEKKKEEITISREELEAISSKSKYSVSAVNAILRGYVPKIPRHDIVFELYKKVKHLRELHNENYTKDLQNL